MRSEAYNQKLQSALDFAAQKSNESSTANQAYANKVQERSALQAKLSQLETSVLAEQKKITELDSKLADPPQVETSTTDEKGETITTMQPDQAEIAKIQAEKTATEEALAAAKAEVETAKTEAAAISLEPVAVSEADVEKMTSFLTYMDDLITAEEAGNVSSEEDLDSVQNQMQEISQSANLADHQSVDFWTKSQEKLEKLNEIAKAADQAEAAALAAEAAAKEAEIVNLETEETLSGSIQERRISFFQNYQGSSTSTNRSQSTSTRRYGGTSNFNTNASAGSALNTSANNSLASSRSSTNQRYGRTNIASNLRSSSPSINTNNSRRF